MVEPELRARGTNEVRGVVDAPCWWPKERVPGTIEQTLPLEHVVYTWVSIIRRGQPFG